MRKLLIFFSVLILPVISYSSETDVPAGQEKKLTVEMQGRTTKEVLDHIEQNSDYIFFYGEGIDTRRIVSISVNNGSVKTILDALFKGTDVRYEIHDRQITLKKVTNLPPPDKIRTQSHRYRP